MEAARATWTDSRLDDLKETVVGIDQKLTRLDQKVDEGFTRLDTKIDEKVGRLDKKVEAGFDRVNDRIDKLQHSMIVVGGGLIAAMLAVLAAMLGMVITILLHHV